MNARRDDRRDASKERSAIREGDAAPNATPVETDDDLFSATAVEEPVPFRESAEKPNPLAPAYLASKSNATGEGEKARGSQMRVPPPGRVFPTEDRANAALALVRRAASDSKGGATTRIRPETVNGVKGFALYFAWRPRSKRTYTSADVRKWAGEQTPPLTVPDKGRVPLDVVNAYRAAHGLPPSTGGKSKGTETPAPAKSPAS